MTTQEKEERAVAAGGILCCSWSFLISLKKTAETFWWSRGAGNIWSFWQENHTRGCSWPREGNKTGSADRRQRQKKSENHSPQVNLLPHDFCSHGIANHANGILFGIEFCLNLMSGFFSNFIDNRLNFIMNFQYFLLKHMTKVINVGFVQRKSTFLDLPTDYIMYFIGLLLYLRTFSSVICNILLLQ